MASMIGEVRPMHVSTRKEGHVVVTNVTKAETVSEYYPTSQEHSVLAIPPTTPNPKINQKKTSASWVTRVKPRCKEGT
ncbi:hypothetical protein HanXRQr2_Chr15g0699161 [Helianthus annuus]|uniref:Uncharacterized protein n=1 Tax=Helianthus annuus TaxID=4232 RepID=A0A9K3E1L3_HELAN|nr:hypothetical protein HanXRQr2_Chr15g0699161 [Helianthus annuus]KAJ0473521.1 hypothetical protein HanHA89_Chr15g0619291 [Helianthus annuus]KAJ0831767.1 hypothetical protein HanPSC8_Chr15g0670911 [Helianthus annuus]